MGERNGRVNGTAAKEAPPPRVLFFGKRMSRSRCTSALVEAWRENGSEVRWLNMATLRRWLGERYAKTWARRAFRSFQPDVVCVFCRDLPADLVEAFRAEARVVMWVEESLDDLDQSYLDYFAKAHLVCLSNPARIPQLKQHGIDNAAFLMSGFMPRFHKPLRGARIKRDLAFIGGPGRNGCRADLLHRLAEDYDIEVFGMQWENQSKHPRIRVTGAVDNRGFSRVCATSRIVIGMNQNNDDDHYFSNRTWLTLGCRGFHLTHYVPGLEDVFEDGVHLTWFHDQDEALAKVRKYLADDEARECIAEAGHQLALKRHQYTHRIAEVISLLQGINDPAAPAVVLPPRRTEAAPLAGRLSTSPVRD